MKCPWRIIKEVRHSGMGFTTSETHFDECYKEECPFYVYMENANGQTIFSDCKRRDKS